MADENGYKSLNPYTGMVEDVEDIRDVGLVLARALQRLLSNPFIQMDMPPEMLMTGIAFAVRAEALLRPMSAAEQYRIAATISGTPPEVVALYEQMVGGLSETLPSTHPEVQAKLDRVLEVHGLTIKGTPSESETPNTGGPTQPLPELPPEIEKFLHSLGKDENGDEGDGTNKGS